MSEDEFMYAVNVVIYHMKMAALASPKISAMINAADKDFDEKLNADEFRSIFDAADNSSKWFSFL